MFVRGFRIRKSSVKSSQILPFLDFMTSSYRRPLALIILDGWGSAEKTDGNAVALAHTPNYDEICSRYPMTKLAASGESVGLAAGSPGSAEAGHLNIGAGRVV